MPKAGRNCHAYGTANVQTGKRKGAGQVKNICRSQFMKGFLGDVKLVFKLLDNPVTFKPESDTI